MEGSPVLICMVGYVFSVGAPSRLLIPFRDLTHRKLLHFRGISMDRFDDGGLTFPTLTDLTPEEFEYIEHSLDDVLSRGTPVAYLKEFWDQQNGKWHMYH